MGCTCSPCITGAVVGALGPPATPRGRDGAGEAQREQGSLWDKQPLPDLASSKAKCIFGPGDLCVEQRD